MKVIPEFPNYKIDVHGNVWTCYQGKGSAVRVTETWRVLEPVVCSKTGYKLVTLCGNGIRKNKRIHRLLMEAFVPNPHSKAHVNHIDGNKLNNAFSNLEWATPKENAVHAHKTGLCEHVTAAQRVEVEQRDPQTHEILATHISIHEAGRSTGIAWQNISKVVRGIRPRAGGYSWTYRNV